MNESTQPRTTGRSGDQATPRSRAANRLVALVVVGASVALGAVAALVAVASSVSDDASIGTYSGIAGFPTRRSAGLPEGWEPERVIDGDFVADEAGQLVADLRINGALIVAADDVTVRRVEVVGGHIENFPDEQCHGDLVIEDSTIRRSDRTATSDPPAVGTGGYTARRVLIDGKPEGFRVGAGESCGPVVIEDSYARVVAPDDCGDWHGDALQGYFGGALTIRNSVLELVEREGCRGTAPFFYPDDQGNASVDVDGLVVIGGGYSFRLGTAGSVGDLNIVDATWHFEPVEVACADVTPWTAWIVTLQDGQPVRQRRQPCEPAT